jgi:hypothetical protein
MATTPQYASTPINGAVNIATANALRDGSGTLGTLITAGTNGTRVDDIYITATGTTTAGIVRMFLSNGTTNYLIQELIVSAVTVSATVPAWSQPITNKGLVLQNGWSLKFSTQNAESFNIVVTRAGNL